MPCVVCVAIGWWCWWWRDDETEARNALVKQGEDLCLLTLYLSLPHPCLNALLCAGHLVALSTHKINNHTSFVNAFHFYELRMKWREKV